MIHGIVGSGADKFTELGKRRALKLISRLLSPPEVTGVSSGRSPLGGVDEWAEWTGNEFGMDLFIFPARVNSWNEGYKPRNIRIALKSDEVHVIIPDSYPPQYRGKRFKMCYHCKTSDHIKSGGCWTGHFAKEHDKKVFWHVVEN